ERTWRAGRRCRGRGRRSRRCAPLQDIALPASSRTAGAVAEVLCKVGVVLLHSRRGAGVPVGQRAIDHIEACLSLIQSQLEAGAAAPREVLGTPFNVEDPVGSSATCRGEYAKPTVH